MTTCTGAAGVWGGWCLLSGYCPRHAIPFRRGESAGYHTQSFPNFRNAWAIPATALNSPPSQRHSSSTTQHPSLCSMGCSRSQSPAPHMQVSPFQMRGLGEIRPSLEMRWSMAGFQGSTWLRPAPLLDSGVLFPLCQTELGKAHYSWAPPGGTCCWSTCCWSEVRAGEGHLVRGLAGGYQPLGCRLQSPFSAGQQGEQEGSLQAPVPEPRGVQPCF